MKLQSLFSLPLFFSLLACNGRPERFPDVERTERLPYGYHYQLKTQANPLKRVLFLHGGGLLAGSALMRRFDEVARHLATQNFEVLSVEYPLLWQGLSLTNGADLIHCALSTFAGSEPVAMVGVSAGSWLGLRGLSASPSSGPCLNHPPVDRFAGISPMLQPRDAFGPHLVAAWFERTWEIPRITRQDFPSQLFILHGRRDWLVPEPNSREFCSADQTAQNTGDCTRIVTDGGHFLLNDGRAGSESDDQKLIEFLAR